jgi:hypothetical protein
MLIGYARVSTEDQHLDLLLAALEKAGCKQFDKDMASGAKDEREGLRQAVTVSSFDAEIMHKPQQWRIQRIDSWRVHGGQLSLAS